MSTFSRNEAEISKGKLIGQNGPGSLYVNVEGISYTISAADNWYASKNVVDKESFAIQDSRLSGLLNVEKFYEVPEYIEEERKKDNTNKEIKIPMYRFPLAHYCSSCGYFQDFKSHDYLKEKHCDDCDSRKIFLQFPLVVVCEKGHLSDFPYQDFVHRNKPFDSSHKVKVVKVGSSIMEWILKCDCGAKHSLIGITGQAKEGNQTPFQKEMGGVQCKGEKPWADTFNHDEGCEHSPTAILRNSIGVYQAEIFPALLISENVNEDTVSIQEVIQDEFARLSLQIEEPDKNKLDVHKSFETSDNTIIKKVNRVNRLQELIVQTGFHRLSHSDEENSLQKARDYESPKLIFNDSMKKPSWYPAKKQFGEGIFIEFNENVLQEWANLGPVKKRYNDIKDRTEDFYLQDKFKSPINIMIHTLSHALIHELSKSSGYSITSIRERLYVEDGNYGLLIYVTDTDKDGTFGGLVRLGNKENFEMILPKALRNMEWCSSDPVCFEIGDNRGQGIEESNGSACHNCCFTPTTSCSYRNCFLDRDFIGRSQSNACISEHYEWLDNIELDFSDFQNFGYESWKDVPRNLEENTTYYEERNLKTPLYVDGKIKINDISLEVKYLWEEEHRIELYKDQNLRGNIPEIVQGWEIFIEQ